MIEKEGYILQNQGNQKSFRRKTEHQKFKVYFTYNNVTNFLNEIIDNFQY